MSRTVPFVHSTKHWDQSIAPAGPLLAFSELRRGQCPVVTNTFTVNYVLEGVERYRIGDRESRVEAGEILLVEPGAHADATLEGADMIRGISIYLPTPADASASVADPDLIRGFRFRAGHCRLGQVLAGLRDLLASGATPTPDQSAGYIAAVASEFDLVSSTLAAELMRVDATKPSTRRHILQRVHRARDYLLSHDTRAVPLSEVANVVGMSQFHLARSFAAVFGRPPSRYHAAARIAAADMLIRSGKLDIAEAAARFGFSDRSSFARAFRRERGAYPAAIRSAARISQDRQ